MARGRKRREVRKEDRTEPTPETRAKLTRDPLQAMVEGKLIGTEEERAASEIRAVYLAVCRQVMRKGAILGEGFGVPGGGRPADMPVGLAIAHTETYLPWTRSHHPDIVDATLRVVVDRDEIHLAFRLDVAEALQDYAKRMVGRKIVDFAI